MCMQEIFHKRKYKIMTKTSPFLPFYIVMICVTWYNKYSGKSIEIGNVKRIRCDIAEKRGRRNFL